MEQYIQCIYALCTATIYELDIHIGETFPDLAAGKQPQRKWKAIKATCYKRWVDNSKDNEG